MQNLVLKIGTMFVPVSSIATIQPQGTKWEILFNNPQISRVQVPIDTKGSEIGSVLEALWAETKQYAKKLAAEELARNKEEKNAKSK